MLNALQESIIKTLVYFDFFNFPLTKEELFRYLWILSPTDDSLGAFHQLSLPPQIATKDGYYFIAGREKIIAERERGAKISEQKLTIARRAVKLIRSVPFLKAIFVCNSVGAGMARPESDIDFFIITEKNRIWIVRFFTNLILRIFRLRTYGAHQADRICLSFFVDIDHLNLAPWRVVDDDVHFAYWLNMMTPVYDTENYHQRLLQANVWTRNYLPHCQPSPNLPRGGASLVVDTRLGKVWKRAWEVMWRGVYGDMVEKQARELQWMRMKLSVKDKANLPDHGVVITDGVLKFHENDTRHTIREKWLEKLKLLNC